MIGSCHIHQEYEKPAVDISETYRNDATVDSTSFADLEWWELFNDTILVGLIRDGLENNITVANTAMRIKQSQLQYEIAHSFQSPQINYGAKADVGGSTVTTGATGNIVAGVNVSYTVDVWGRLANQRDAALQAYLATEIAYYEVKASLVAQIASLYFALRDVDNKIIVSEDMIVNMTNFRDVIEARYIGGFVSKVDVNQADIRLKSTENTLQSLIRARNQLENALSIAVGSTPRTIERGLRIDEQLITNEMPVGVPGNVLSRRPDILRNERRLIAQMRVVDATHALKYPDFTISFDLGTQLFNPALILSNLAANIAGPLMNAGRIENTIKFEEEEYKIVANDFIQTYLVALQEVEDALVEITTYRNEYEIRQAQLDLSQEALDLSWVRYSEGVTPLLDFLNVQTSLFSSQLQISESYRLRLQSMVKLYLALGGGWDYTYVNPDEEDALPR